MWQRKQQKMTVWSSWRKDLSWIRSQVQDVDVAVLKDPQWVWEIPFALSASLSDYFIPNRRPKRLQRKVFQMVNLQSLPSLKLQSEARELHCKDFQVRCFILHGLPWTRSVMGTHWPNEMHENSHMADKTSTLESFTEGKGRAGTTEAEREDEEKQLRWSYLSY